MARAVRILLFALAGAALVAAGAWLVLFHSPPGRTFLAGAVADALGEALGADATIARLGGRLPGEILVDDLALADSGGHFLTVRRLRIVWRPLALAGQRVKIESMELRGGRLLRRPEEAERTAPPRGFALPERLPRLSIGRLAIEDFRADAAVAGEALRLDGEGRAQIGGRDLDLALSLSGARDRADIALRRSGEDFSIRAKLASEDGALAALAGAGGPLLLETEGAGPVAAAQIALRAGLGAIGELEAEIEADARTLDRIAAKGIFRPGPRLADLARMIGPEARFALAFAPDEKGGDLDIAALKGDFGEARGAATWRNRAGALDLFTARLDAELAQDWRPDIRRWTGGAAAAALELKAAGDAYGGRFSLKTERGALELADLRTDLRSGLEGAVSGALDPDPEAPAGLKGGVAGNARLDFLRNKTISLAGLDLKSADGADFKGAASYDFAAETFRIDGAAAAEGALIAQLAPDLVFDRPVAAEISAEGAFDDFAARLTAATPPARMGGAALSPARIEAAFAGLPRRPAGKARADALDGSGRVSADALLDADGVWRLSKIDYRGPGFTLSGSADIDPARRQVVIEVAYAGDDGAEPFPGLLAAGAMTLEANLSGADAPSRIALKADSLAAGPVRLRGLDALAAGPLSALTLRASAATLAADRIALAAPRLAATVDARGPVRAVLSEFAAAAGGRTLALDRPAALAFGEATEIEGLALKIGPEGRLDLDASFSRDRWRARLEAKKIVLEDAAAAVDADIDLDTERPLPASGRIAVASLLTGEAADRIGLQFAWDGRRLGLADDGADPEFALEAGLPFALQRAPDLRVEIAGPVSGAARYGGRIEPLAAFFPPALQSLEGALALEARVAGEWNAPRFSGSAKLTDGAYTELETGLSLIGIEATAGAVSQPGGGVIDFTARASGPGQSAKTVAAAGRIALSDEAAIDIRLAFDGARLAAGPVSAAVVSGAITLSGPADDLRAEGELKVASLEAEIAAPEPTGLVPVRVVAVGADDPAQAPGEAARPARLAYDIRLVADDRVFVRGRGVDSEWRADMRLSGDSGAPLLLGEVALRGGHVDFAGRRFDFARGTLAFDRLSPNDPALDLRAERTTAGGVAAAIEATGRATAPKIALQSSPALPPEDVMALVLFDKPANELTALESLEVAQALAALGGIGPFGGAGIAGRARAALGLDLLSVDLDAADAAATSLTVGKYVANGVFVAATQDARGENGSVRIEFDIGRSFTVETELRQDGDQTVSANWRKDF